MSETYAYGGDPTGLTGKYHYGIGGLGTLGSLIPSTGTHGPAPIFPCLSLPADANKEYYAVITSVPVGLTLFANEDSSVIASGADGPYVVPFDLYEYGVLVGSNDFSVAFGEHVGKSD